MNRNILNTVKAMSSPPSPPPPPKKKNRKALIAILVIVLVVVVIAGAYLATRGNGNTNPNATPTPTFNPNATPTPTANPSATSNPSTSGTGANVAGATSLQFTVSITNSSGGSQGSYTYYAKNAGTANQMVRIEWTDPSGGSSVYIVNGALQKVWVETGGQWTDLSSAYASQSSSWNSAFLGYKNSLTSWSGIGDWTYTDPNGDTVRISNVNVNPSLPDSLFQQS
jgi:hypothetical protein